MIDPHYLDNLCIQLENEMWVKRKQTQESKIPSPIMGYYSDLREDEILRDKIWDEYRYNKTKEQK